MMFLSWCVYACVCVCVCLLVCVTLSCEHSKKVNDILTPNFEQVYLLSKEEMVKFWFNLVKNLERKSLTKL